jgi:hypothetical protein
MNTVVAFVLAAIGSKRASQTAGSMSWASLATSSRLAVCPRGLALSAADRNRASAWPTATM